MRELAILDATYVRGPGCFAAIEIPPGCVFYMHRSVMERSNRQIVNEIAHGLTALPEGMTVDMLSIHRQAWALAKVGIAGRG